MLKNDYSLDQIFAFMDKDLSKTVSIEEITRGLSSVLSADESRALFMAIDLD